ncbi:helix-turn-helix transcriptional regulator [Amnibacterium endophyticum]|uniref:Helix-turn-helix transcriptional regulator n=1 Tax=Amnibacterium endophyticum TaxID=2109337 RepID=A0ABW4LIJ1_9MICO
MGRPTARVLELLELLQSGGVRTARDLAGRLGVDERTVRRYVEHLIELDVPVEAVRGRYGGFRIAAGAHLPPLMFTDDEALAVMLGLAVSAREGPSSAARVAAETAAAKIARVLPARLADRASSLSRTPSTGAGPRPAEVDTSVMLAAVSAVEQRRPLRVVHRRGASATERTVLPWEVVEHAGRWYLVGLDSRSDAVRTFRLDRLERVEPLPGRFDRPPTADPRAEVLGSLARAPREHVVRVEVRTDAERVRRLLPASIALVEPAHEDGWLLLQLQAARLDWVAGVLVQLDVPFRVLEPGALEDEIRGLARRALARL